MGNGRVVGDRLNFQATATFAMTPTDAFRWRCAFTKGSELLYNATEGQLRFGRIFVTTNGLAVADADYKLTDVGDRAFATFGGFGDDGRSVTFPPYAQTQVLSIVHETGHHVFALGEEYSFALSERVDAGATLPAGHGNLIIPLQNAASARPDADFDDATVFIRFGDILETRDVVSKVGDRVTVDAAFTEDPRDAVWATFQWDAECTDDRTTGACIMEFSRSNAGEMDAGCNWTPTTNPVTEFCTTFNHDPDQNTGQHRDRVRRAGARSSTSSPHSPSPPWGRPPTRRNLPDSFHRSGSCSNQTCASLWSSTARSRWTETAEVDCSACRPARPIGSRTQPSRTIS